MRRGRFNPKRFTHRDRYLNAHFGPGGRPKVPFASIAAAQHYLDRRGVEGSIYECDVCGKHHIGHLKDKANEDQ